MSIPQNFHELENFAFQKEHSEFFPDQTAYSLPVFTQRGQQVYQAAFLFEDSVDSNLTLPRPFAWWLLPLDSRPEYLFSWCKALDFMDTSQYPLDQRVSAIWPAGPLKKEKRQDYLQEIQQLFQQMIDFAFKDPLSTAQRNILERYQHLFLHLAYRGLYPFYQALAPDFFRWLDMVLLPPEEDPLEIDPVQVQLERLAALFESKISNDRQKEKLFDQLHEELQQHKRGGYEELSLAMQRDVILVVDSIEETLNMLEPRDASPGGYEKLLELFRGVRQDLVDLLYRQGVDPYTVSGDQVEIPQQKVLETIPTNNPQLDKTVSRRLTGGWSKGERIVRPEYVQVYMYQSPQNPRDPEETQEEEQKENDEE